MTQITADTGVNILRKIYEYTFVYSYLRIIINGKTIFLLPAQLKPYLKALAVPKAEILMPLTIIYK